MTNDIEQLKRQHNIVDIIGQTVELKKRGEIILHVARFMAKKRQALALTRKNNFIIVLAVVRVAM